MSLKHIILGILDEPHSGYDIKRQFEQVFRHFWSAELAQIYPVLGKLEREGLSRSKLQPSKKGPPRRLYKRSAKGTRELQKWLARGPMVGQDRLAYLAQVFFLSDLDAGRRLAYFEKLKARFAVDLAELEQTEAMFSKAPGYPDKLSDYYQCRQFTLRLGLTKLRGNLEWCDECIAIIRKSLRGHKQSA